MLSVQQTVRQLAARDMQVRAHEQPSSADRAVAAKANAQAAQARVELAQQNQSRLDTVTQIAESDSTYNRRGIGISNKVTGAIAAGRIIDLIA